MRFFSIIESTGASRPLIEAAESAFYECFPEVRRSVIGSAYSNMGILDESMDMPSDPEIIRRIDDGDFETGDDLDRDYPVFMESLSKSRHPLSLTPHDLKDYHDLHARLYKVRGYDAGFAVCGDGDIISVHNNTHTRDVGIHLIKAAKRLGGKTLDHYDIPQLNKAYGGAGMSEYKRSAWDDRFMPEGWDKDTMGTPDVVYRRF